MEKLVRQLKKYDKFLDAKRLLDGTVKIYRQSPFSHFQFDVLTIQNKYLGSCSWVRKRISQKDQQRHDHAGDVEKINWARRNERKDSRTTREIADFVLRDSIVI